MHFNKRAVVLKMVTNKSRIEDKCKNTVNNVH